MLLVIFVLIAIGSLAAFSNSSDDRAVIFNNIEINEGEVVDGNVAAIFGNVKNKGIIKGDVAAIFGNVQLSGRIEGDTVAVLGSVKLDKGAFIGGDTASIGGSIDRAADSRIEGEVADVGIPFVSNVKKPAFKVNTISIIGLILIYGLSCLAFVIIPERINFMAEQLWNKMPRRFGIGFLAFLLVIPIIIALVITLVGILAIPFFILAFILLVFIAKVVMFMALGHKTTGNLCDKSAPYIYLFVGVVIIYAFNFIPVLGFIINIIITCIALGTAIDTKLGGGRFINPRPAEEGPAEALRPLDIPRHGGNE